MINQEIERRVDAYRGNPQALMQKYQQSQQLIDLLALQKLKSDKEAAMRQMQLAQGQQGTPPTVAQQREQEVTDMTRQEVIEQVGQLAQAQQQAQQQKMQQLLKSGIAQAPGAQTAAQPQAMAAGGIVAFQEGGSIDPEEIAARLRSGEGLVGLRQSMLGERPQSRNPQALIEWNNRSKEFDSAFRQAQGLLRQAPAPSGAQRSAPAAPTEAAAPSEAPAPSAPPQRARPDFVETMPEEVYSPTRGPGAPAEPAKPASLVSEEDLARAAKPTSVASGLQSLAQNQGNYSRLQQALATLTGPQPGSAEQQKAIAEYQALLDPKKRSQFPGMMGEEERKARIEQVRREQQAQFDPEKMRYQNLINFFLGGAGRTGIGSVLGGAGAAGLQSQLAQEAGQREGARGIREMEEGLLQRKETYERDKYLADQAERKLQMDARGKLMDTFRQITEGNDKRASELALKTMEIAAGVDKTEAQIRAEIGKTLAELNVKISENQLNRIVELAKVESAAQDRRLTREQRGLADDRDNYRQIKLDYQQRLERVETAYNTAAKEPNNMSPRAAAELKQKRDSAIRRLQNEYTPLLNQYETRLGLPLTSNAMDDNPEQKALDEIKRRAAKQ